MMKAILRNLAIIVGISLIGLSSYAQAKHAANHKSVSTATEKIQSHFVQIFSSINPTKAEGMKNTLEMKGYPAFIKIRDKLKQPFYQVQVGPFNSKRLAQGAKSSIVQSYPQFPFLNEAILKIALKN